MYKTSSIANFAEENYRSQKEGYQLFMDWKTQIIKMSEDRQY